MRETIASVTFEVSRGYRRTCKKNPAANEAIKILNGKKDARRKIKLEN